MHFLFAVGQGLFLFFIVYGRCYETCKKPTPGLLHVTQVSNPPACGMPPVTRDVCEVWQRPTPLTALVCILPATQTIPVSNCTLPFIYLLASIACAFRVCACPVCSASGAQGSRASRELYTQHMLVTRLDVVVVTCSVYERCV